MSDKRSRVVLISRLIQNGTIMFPKEGAEDPITQLIDLGKEHHGDLVDAFATAVQITEDINNSRGFETWIELVQENGGSRWI